MIFATLKENTSFKKVYLLGLIFGGGLMLILALSEVLALGVNQTLTHYFPGYQTFARVSVGGTIDRLEIISGITFIIGGFIKISVLLLAISRGTAKIFNLKNYRNIVTSIGLLVANLSYVFYKSTMVMFQWIADYWGYFAVPFELIMPVLLYVIVKIKRRMIVFSKD